jgi:hypothetical protein
MFDPPRSSGPTSGTLEDDMTFRNGLALAAVLAIAACAGPNSTDAKGADALATLMFAEGAASSKAPASGDANAFRLDVAFEKRDGSRLAMPALISRPGRAVAVEVGESIQYVADFDLGDITGPGPSKPVTRTVLDGARIDACVQRAADGGITLGYRVTVSKVERPIAEHTTTLAGGPPVTIQLPYVTEVTAQGTRWIEPDAWAMLARVASPDSSGPLLVLARVAPIRVEVTPAEDVFSAGPSASDFAATTDLARPMTGRTVHLRVSAVRTSRSFDPGSVLDETAAPDVLKSSGGEILRDFEAFTCLDSRVRLSAFVGVPGGAFPSFTAAMADDGRVTITWNRRTANVRANEGRRFVAVAPIEGGGTAGVIVSVDADD